MPTQRSRLRTLSGAPVGDRSTEPRSPGAPESSKNAEERVGQPKPGCHEHEALREQTAGVVAPLSQEKTVHIDDGQHVLGFRIQWHLQATNREFVLVTVLDAHSSVDFGRNPL